MQLKQTAIDLDETVYVQYRRLSALDQHVRANIAGLTNQKSLASLATGSPESPWVAAEKLCAKLHVDLRKKETAKSSPAPNEDSEEGSMEGVAVGNHLSELSCSAALFGSTEDDSASNDSASAAPASGEDYTTEEPTEEEPTVDEWARDNWLHVLQYFATGNGKFLLRNWSPAAAAAKRSLSLALVQGFEEAVTRNCAGDSAIHAKAVAPDNFPECPWEQTIQTLDKLTGQLN